MKSIRYRLAVTATMPLTDDPKHPDFYTEEAATSARHQRELEKSIFKLLKPSDCDCDVELLDYAIVEDDALDAAIATPEGR